MTIIVYKPNGAIFMLHPVSDKFGVGENKRPFSECVGLQKYINPEHPDFVGTVHEWAVLDAKPSKDGLESRVQLHWVEEGGKKVIRRDEAWEHRIMPDDCVKKRKIAAAEKQLDALLADDKSDAKAVLKAQRAVDICKAEKDPAVITQWALDGLDARVAKGEPDKPKIREQLLAKLNAEPV